MTVTTLVECAAVAAGLCEVGSVPDALKNMGLTFFNRWYRFCWHKYPHRDIRIAEASVAVPAGDGVVVLPTSMDGIRVVSDGVHALLPLDDSAAADFADLFVTASGVPHRYVVLPDTVSGTDPVRQIRLLPAPSSALTLYVNGLRRFVDLALTDAILLTRCVDALYFYVLGDFQRFQGNFEAKKDAFKDAKEHFDNAVKFEVGAAECDAVQLPTDSLHEG